ncbi:hypothetical protein [Microbacterium trichothecenolyticum]|uniref:Vacuolar-type H+-ATPase subunit I/STV1 n=1 Tax=Microbacterium trichothecenolyticum TaxID=69370 RepID=A0ABU0TPS6_MICTR|nr:hypothetical protein [Microbacterium trichothecenolyticum]MDQ1121676.1 vacuolar-type H+-ATPase subunit I/STV1 [Microbacterium trichothecenolyticum]
MSSASAPNGPTFAAPHVAPPAGTLLTPPPAVPRGRRLGTWALILSLIATVLASAVGGLLAFRIVSRVAPDLQTAATIEARMFSPVRDLVLAGEITFWAATVIGLAAFVLGIVATARNAARGAGIAAIVVSALGPLVFGAFVIVAIAGAAAAMSTGGASIT